VFTFLKKKYRRSESRRSDPSTSVGPALPLNSKETLIGNIYWKKSSPIILLTFVRRMRWTLKKPSDNEAALSN